MRRHLSLATTLTALAALLLLCGGCDDDPASPTEPDGGYGLLRSGMVYDFSRGIEAERDSLPHDLELQLSQSGSCNGDSCDIYLTLTLATPPGGRIIDLGLAAMSAVEWLPDAGYVTELVWSDAGRIPYYSTDAALDGISDDCVDHTFVVIDPDGNEYLMTVLDAPLWSGGSYWNWDACLEFVWRRFP